MALHWREGFKAKKNQPPTSEKNEAVFLVPNVNSLRDLRLENWQLGLKVFLPTSKMYIRLLYVKGFKSSDLFVFSILP